MRKIFILILILLSFGTQVQAAELSFVVPESVQVGTTFEAVVNLQSDGVYINAADIVVNFDKDFLTFAGYKEADGVLGFWIERPHLENGEVHLAGVIPGGVNGTYDPNKAGLQPIGLAKILFIAKKPGITNMFYTKSQVLKHDGLGSELAHTRRNANITILAGKSTVDTEPEPVTGVVIDDIAAPDSLSVEYFESNLFLKTPSIISFYSSDRDSGVSHYEMQIGDGDWRRVESPRRLSESLFKRRVSIRAYDFAGNYRETAVTVPGSVTLWVLAVCLVFVLFLLAIYEIFLFKKKHPRKF